MQAVRVLKINLKNNTQVIPDTFKLENYAVQVILDYTDCGVEGKRKFVDLRNARNEDFRYDLGTEDIVSFYLTNDVTHAEGELLINPLVLHELTISGRPRQQLIGFKTFRYNIQDSIAAYEGEAGDSGVYDDVILPIQQDVMALFDLIEAHRQRLEILEMLTGEGGGEYPDLASWLLGMQARIELNEIDIDTLFDDMIEFRDQLATHTLNISEQYDGIHDLDEKYRLLVSDLDGFTSKIGSVETTIEKVIQDVNDIGGGLGPLSIPGRPGHDGGSQYPTYIWIKFADTPTSGMSTYITEKEYIGYAFNQTLRKPLPNSEDNYNRYKWQPIEGEAKGIYDRDNIDGYPLYTWVKFANDLIGTDFSDNPFDKMYIGLAYDNLDPNESENYEDYEWFLVPGYFTEQLVILNKKTIKNETRIQQTEEDIVLAAQRATTIEGRVTENEGAISVTADNLNLLVTEVEHVDGKVDINTGAINIESGRVDTVVSEISTIDGKVNANTSSISTQLGLIELKVNKGDIASTINTTAQSVAIDSSKINLTGFVTVTDLSGSGTTTIDGSNISTGVIKSNNDKTKIDLDSGTFLIGNSTSDYEMYYNGSTLALGGNTTISWANIGNKPYIPTVPNYITSTKITSTTIESPTITAGSITGAEITGGTITSNTNINVTTDLHVGDNIYLGEWFPSRMKMIRFSGSATISGGFGDAGADMDIHAQILSLNSPDVQLGVGPYGGHSSGYSEFTVKANQTVTGTLTCSNYTASTYSMNLKPNNGNGGTVYSFGDFRPSNGQNLGDSSTAGRWSNVYIKTGAINESSDIRLKSNITDIPDDLLEYFAKEVKPKMFEVDGKIHFGYIAQDVERALYKYALDKVGLENAREYVDEFNLLGKDESYLSLVYNQIAILKEVELRDRISRLELQIEELEDR